MEANGAQTIPFAETLYYSTGEYASPVWNRPSRAKHIYVALNETRRIIIGCMKPTPTENVFEAADFAARRKDIEYTEKCQQSSDDRHALYGAQAPRRRLKYRKSFLTMTKVEPSL